MTRHHTPTRVGLGPIDATVCLYADAMTPEQEQRLVDALAVGGAFVWPIRRLLPPLLPAQRRRVAGLPLRSAAQWRDRTRLIRSYHAYWNPVFQGRSMDDWALLQFAAERWERTA